MVLVVQEDAGGWLRQLNIHARLVKNHLVHGFLEFLGQRIKRILGQEKVVRSEMGMERAVGFLRNLEHTRFRISLGY